MLLRDGARPLYATAGTDGIFRIGIVPPGDYKAYAWNDLATVEYADAEWMRRNAGIGMAVPGRPRA